MIKAKKGVALVYRQESANDFIEIAHLIRKIDPTIAVSLYPDHVNMAILNYNSSILPMLVVYLVNPPPPFTFNKFAQLAVYDYKKTDEQNYFKSAGLPYLPTQEFKWGGGIDPELYGDWVVLKPSKISSTGRSINMVPTRLVHKLKIEDFPQDHLIHKDNYLIQKFIKTGKKPIHYRATVFLDEVILSWNAEHNNDYPDFNSNLETLLSKTVASNEKAFRKVFFKSDADLNELAIKTAKFFPHNPIFGIDLIRDEATGKYYILELNSGGNVWHFSSKEGVGPREGLGGRTAMLSQYKALEKSAHAIINKTHLLAR